MTITLSSSDNDMYEFHNIEGEDKSEEGDSNLDTHRSPLTHLGEFY